MGKKEGSPIIMEYFSSFLSFPLFFVCVLKKVFEEVIVRSAKRKREKKKCKQKNFKIKFKN